MGRKRIDMSLLAAAAVFLAARGTNFFLAAAAVVLWVSFEPSTGERTSGRSWHMVEDEISLRRARQADAHAKGVDDWTSTDIANFISSHTKGHGQRFTAGTIERAGLTPETMFDHYHYFLYKALELNSA